jgi:hypothetical protein
MKNITILFFALLMLSGCITQQKCDRKFPCKGHDSLSVITNTKLVYRDTTIYVYLPGQTVRDTVKIYLDANSIMHSDVSKLYTSLAESWAWVENGKLMHRLTQNDTLLAQHIKNAIMQSFSTVTTSENKTIIKEVNRINGWQWFQIWVGRLFALIIAVYFGFKVVKNYLKFP